MEANQQVARSTSVETREPRKYLALCKVRNARQAKQAAEESYARYFAEAQAAGCTASELSRALGISRTAVYKQLNRKEG